jgi:hypothetical protein
LKIENCRLKIEDGEVQRRCRAPAQESPIFNFQSSISDPQPAIVNPTRDPAARPGLLLRLVLVGLLCVSTAGCGGCGGGIDSLYGRRSGTGAAGSVNGTAVLAEMFGRAGHTVSTQRILSPRVRDRADCIVWFPDDFQVPSQPVCQWLEDWLGQQPGRTLIYVGRDFDAATFYWEKVLPEAPAEQKAEIGRRLQSARNDFSRARRMSSGTADCDFFSVKGQFQPRKVRSLQGDPAWLGDVDPAKVEIELGGRFVPPRSAEVLLESDGDVLVTRQWWDQGQVFVITNGSFLLNLPLVNHEHRKLAGRLIDEVGAAPQSVVFLESSSGGPPVADEDPSLKIPTGMEFFHEWPANWILLHLSLVGILFCFWRLPIFGRPAAPEPEALSDFGRHIEALGDLLRQSQDRAYAMTRLVHYQQSVRKKE